MGQVIAISNQKGGVGKTATSMALIAGLSKRGYKTLGIDLDPQGNLTSFMGVDCNVEKTIYDVLHERVALKDIIQETNNGLLAPANMLLSGVEKEIDGTGREYRLRNAVALIKNNFDFIIIDTSPSLGTLTINALTAADKVLVPLDSDEGSIVGLAKLWEISRPVKEYCNRDLEIIGAFFNVYDSRTIVGKDIKKSTAEFIVNNGIETRVFESSIRRAEAVIHSRITRTNIFDFDSKSKIVSDYEALIDELLFYLGGSNNG